MESDSVVERTPLTDSTRTSRPFFLNAIFYTPSLFKSRSRRSDATSTAHSVGGELAIALGLIAVLFANFVWPESLLSRCLSAEVGLPLSDPKFAIDVFAHSATKRTQGIYEVVTVTGGVRIYQGAFAATCETAHLWIDRSQPELNRDAKESREASVPLAKKIIIQTAGNSDVRWSDEQRLQDYQWMGRLFSHFDVGFHVDTWLEPTGTTPELNWNARSPVSDTVAWTSADDASHTRLASQITGLSAIANDESLPGPVVQSPPRGGTAIPNNAQGQGITIGNSQLGGTVLDAGSLPLFESIQPPKPSLANPEPVQAFQVPSAFGPAPVVAPVALSGPVSPGRQSIGARTFAFSGRGGIEPELKIRNRPENGDSVITISRGIRLMFGGASVQTSSGPMDLGTVLIEADRAVIWTPNLTRLMSQKIDDLPVEVYIEGNVVFQQGQRRIYADRMYYNVQAEYGMILGAEILTPAPQYEGLVRLKADVIQQRSRENFLAYGAALTSSRLGVPRYWLQSDRIELSDQKSEARTSIFGMPVAGQLGNQTGMQARGRNNFVYLEGVPVAYWPVFNTNINTSSFYLSGLTFRNDRIFGNQVFVDWDAYQIFGLQALDGTQWNFSTDYLSKRGFAVGTNFNYNVPNLLHGPATGFLDVWGLYDNGLDYLGSDRINFFPERDPRGRLNFQHRQYLTPDTELWAEVGLISDRNFLEQYFEQEWDTHKDYATALRLRKYHDQQMFDLSGQARVNPFFTETQWLPRLDHYWLGQSVGDVLTYYSHSYVGYAQQKIASTPLNPADAAKFQLQPWEVNASGLVAVTRQELSLPFDTGFYKFVPFISGEAGTWGEDVNGQQITRLTGQTGLRSSLPMVRVFPDVQSSVLNLNGLAHKVNFESEFLYADTTQDLNLFPLYNPIDDNSQEHFRRRLVFNTFGGVLPPQFDATAYAARQAMQRYVSASGAEIVTNQAQSRTGIHQRWQTKRGVPGRERIADVVELDLDAIFFANPDRDNFGQTVGGINYDFRYHIGDRVTLLSDGYYDLFQSGLKATTVATLLSRPGRGDVYFGATSLSGPVSSFVLTSTVNYRLNEKWLAMGGASLDLGSTGTVGQTIGLTRIGESFLIRVGASYDSGRNNTSYSFSIEPRFFQTKGLSSVAGQLIPPAGLYGLE